MLRGGVANVRRMAMVAHRNVVEMGDVIAADATAYGAPILLLDGHDANATTFRIAKGQASILVVVGKSDDTIEADGRWKGPRDGHEGFFAPRTGCFGMSDHPCGGTWCTERGRGVSAGGRLVGGFLKAHRALVHDDTRRPPPTRVRGLDEKNVIVMSNPTTPLLSGKKIMSSRKGEGSSNDGEPPAPEPTMMEKIQSYMTFANSGILVVGLIVIGYIASKKMAKKTKVVKVEPIPNQ